ncbi:MFS transporter [Derxia lacustris]|uniref:MFS transporter n=1 Tax=Derxia lacustris TaxID=764842 RepID=UPI000A1709B2|nr:MFS transporter [Derxia lacustris]
MNARLLSRGRVALLAGHCAGMIDLVALPVWVGALVAHYGLDSQQAGLLATLFLVGAVLASTLVAPRFGRIDARRMALGGFALAALAFGAASWVDSFAALAPLHALAGLSAGAALSMVHGTMARDAAPHRSFAVAGVALGVFAILFYAAAPPLVAAAGGPGLFRLFAGVFLVAAALAALGFPRLHAPTRTAATPAPRLAPAVWFGIVGISCMTIVQSMTFSFVERVGIDRGFGAGAVAGVLVALGFVNLLSGALAGLLERRIPAHRVLLAGPVVQAVLCVTVMSSTGFLPYAVATSVFAAVQIFVHTFVFGLLARLEPSGRALAATPAMLMTGAAVGPILGGTLIKSFGYASVGLAAVAIGAVAVVCYSRLRRVPAPVTPIEAHA